MILPKARIILSVLGLNAGVQSDKIVAFKNS